MNIKDLKDLRPGDVMLIKYINEELPFVEVVSKGVTEEKKFICFESGHTWGIKDTIIKGIKVGKIRREFEFE